MKNCPCNSQLEYQKCCGQFIHDGIPAPTALALMRSRYTAYTLARIDYIERTMKSPAKDHFDAGQALTWAQTVIWKKLEILDTQPGPQKSYVEFKAYYTQNHQTCVLHERSEFDYENGLWFYCAGTMPQTNRLKSNEKKQARNELCLCGSKKKYKKCCGT